MDYVKRWPLWNHLVKFSSISDSWLGLGDFNSVLGLHEKVVHQPIRVACEDFRKAIDNDGLIQVDIRGNFLTWVRLRPVEFSQSKLDRALVNSSCLDKWSSITYTSLPRHHSDHCPLLVHLDLAYTLGPQHFCFSAAWIGHATFQKVVSASWALTINSSNLFARVLTKINMLKCHLFNWSKLHFRDLGLRITKAHNALANIQVNLESNFSEVLQ